MNNNVLLNCSFCKYTTNRYFNLNRHDINKHSKELLLQMNNYNDEKNVVPNEKNVVPNEKNVVPNEKNVVPNGKNVVPNGKNVVPNGNIIIEKYIVPFYNCIKCNKKYKTYKSFIAHEKKCKGLDDLTCPKMYVIIF